MLNLFASTDKRYHHLLILVILVQIPQFITSKTCGTRNDTTSWPWQVQLVDTNPTQRTVLCDGTLLSDQLIITAAHCLHDRNGYPIELELLQVLLADGDLRPTTRTFYPKPYNPTRLDHDLAMVAVDRKVKFSTLVAPACYAAFGKFEAVESPAFGNQTVAMQNETDCRQTTERLFNMTYDGAICFGAYNQSHQYSQNAGTGLVIKSGSNWTLAGVLMYKMGQSVMDQIDYAGGVRIEPYRKWIRRIINHYAEPDLVNKKCKQYTGNPNQNTNLYSVHVMHNPANSFCHGVILSPRFVVTIADCARKTKRIMVNYGQSLKQETFVGSKIYYDDWNNKLALMKLERNISSPGSVISCVWNGKVVQNFTKVLALRSGSLAEENVNLVQYRPGLPLQVRYRCPDRQQNTWNKTFGDLIGVKVAREQRPRIAGLLDGVLPCNSSDYFFNRHRTSEAISLQQYLPWIEDIVWRGGSG